MGMQAACGLIMDATRMTMTILAGGNSAASAEPGITAHRRLP
jgi:hypothetical protein